jgi:hypothetical protein
MPQSGGDLKTAGTVPEEDAMIIDIIRKAGAGKLTLKFS